MITGKQIPLSVGQEAIWIAWKRDPAQWANIIPTPFSVDGRIDVDRLGDAVRAVGAAYPQLRGRVLATADGLALDISGGPEIPVQETVTELGRDEAVRKAWQRPFNLRRGPLARVELLRGPDYTVLVISAHHLVYDGASILILLDALRRAYAGESLHPPEHVAALTAFAEQSRRLTEGPEGEDDREYWKRELGSRDPDFSLPSSVDEIQYTVLEERLPPELETRLRERAAELGVSYVSVLMGGYFALLRRYSGGSEVLSFVPYHGRSSESLGELIGDFVNPLPILSAVQDSDTYAQLIHRVRGRVREAVAHGDLPLPAIMHAAGKTGPDATARTHQTVFQFWHAGLRAGVDVQDLRLETEESGQTSGTATATGPQVARLSLLGMESSAGFVLATMVRKDSRGTHVLWKDPTGAIGPTRVADLSRDFRKILTTIAEDPERRVIPVRTDLPPGLLSGSAPTVDDSPVGDSSLGDSERTATTAVEQPDPASASAGPMTQVWRSVLGVADIGPQDSFFELGGHSLLAEKLVQAVNDRFGADAASIQTLFEYPRLDEFTRNLRISREETSNEEEFPASSFQQRVWLTEQLEYEGASYAVPLAWRLDRPFDPASLQQALAEIVTRHEILRTEFHEHEGELRQILAAPWLPEVTRVDLTAHPEPEKALRDWLRDNAVRSFDPTSGHLFTTALIDLGTNGFGTDEQVFFLCAHHLIWDAETTGLFLAELDSTYATRHQEAASQVRAASPHQERMWFVDRFENGGVYPGAPTYHNLRHIVRLDELPSPRELDTAIAAVVRAHEALRTTFDIIDGQIVQRIHDTITVHSEWTDDLEKAVTEPFDLAQGPLLRVTVQSDDHGGRLAVTAHQAIADPESLRLTARQVLGELQPVPSSFADWQERLSSGTVSVDLEARAHVLVPAADPVRLPERRPREAVHIYTESAVHAHIPADLPVHQLAHRLGIGSDEVLLAAFAVVLSWYTGQTDLPLGLSHHARHESDRHIVGPLANLLPIRLRAEPTESFEQFLSATAREVAHAREHEYALFDELVRRVDPPKDMSRTALFDVLFTVGDESDQPGGYGKYDLHLVLRPRSGGYDATLLYNGRYFDHDQITDFAGHYLEALRQLVAAPEKPLGIVDPISEDERHTQLTVWNATEATYPETPAHELIRQRAEARPHAIALTHEGGEITYRDLFTRAEKLAKVLVEKGVHRGELVALLLPRGPEQIHAILAVLLAGAAYLPIDPSLPEARTSFILGDSGIRTRILPVGHPVEAGVIPTDAEPETNPALPAVSLDSPAYCIYTSGTTGNPKGVVITHRNLVRLLTNERFPFAFSPSDVWTMFHSYAFDFSVWELFGALTYGGRLVLVTDEQTKDPHRFWELIQREQVTVLNQTPSAFTRLLGLEPVSPTSLNRVRYVIFGGEALRPSVLEPWLERYPHVRLVNMYGITETTVHASIRTITRADVETDASVVGGPIPTTRLLLLDPLTGRRLLPVGAIGEIHVGGEGVAGGYLDRPELTAQRFVDSPFGDGKLFRSGDLARYRPDGALEFIGRADSQVQLRGYRIELGEVRAALTGHPDVDDAVVLAEDDRLVAVVATGAELGRRELYRHLAHKLPGYMIPSEFRVVTEIPLTGNGKLDLAAVRAEAPAPPENTGRSTDLPATAAALGQLWSELLGVTDITGDDSFFALGGHSMNAVALVGRIGTQFGVNLPMRTLFEFPRLHDLAEVVDGEREGRIAPASAIDRDFGKDGLDTSPFQRQLWLGDQVEERSRNAVLLSWKTSGRLDLATLDRALTNLVAGHEILRTGFVSTGETLTQVIRQPWRPRLELLLPSDPADPDAELTQWLEDTAAQPFDLTSGRLIRVAVADLGEYGHALLLCMHHLVVDGETVPVLLSELSRYYRDGERASPPQAQYRDFVAGEAAERNSIRRTTDLAFWQEKLSGIESTVDFPELSAPEEDGAVPIALPRGLGARLQPLQTRHSASWFMLVGAALTTALHRWTGQSSLTVAVPVSTRDHDLFPDLLGPCLNTVILRSDLTNRTTVLDVLDALRTETLDAFSHAQAPFEEVLERLAPTRQPGRSPFADVTLNMNLRNDRKTELGGVPLVPVFLDRLGGREAKSGITLTIAEEQGELVATLSYQGNRVSALAATNLATDIGALLTGLADDPDRVLAEIVSPGALATSGTRQYREFVAAQRTAGGTPQRAENLDFWQRKLAGAPPYVDFGTPAEYGPDGVVPVPLAVDLPSRLTELQREHGASAYMVVATALSVLLHRWSGREIVTFGTAVSQRHHHRLEQVLGPCLNIVVLRSRAVRGTRVLELLDTVRAEVLEAFERAETPFEEVVGQLNPPRRPDHSPYSDVVLTFDPARVEPPTVAGRALRAERIDLDVAEYGAKSTLVVSFEQNGAALTGRVAYRGDQIRPEEATRFAVELGDVLDGLAHGLDHSVLAVADREELRRFSRGSEPVAAESVLELVLQAAERDLDHPAIESSAGVLTYGQLIDRAHGLAAEIRTRLHGDSPVVALLLDRGEHLVVSMLATWFAGAAFCPIDPDWPDSRVEFVLGDVHASVLITDERVVPDGSAATVLRISGILPAKGEIELPAGEDPAYVIYTSGTTGHPKGVVVPHRGLAQVTSWSARTAEIGPTDRGGHALGVAFDATQWQVWFTLAGGATLVPHEGPISASTLGRWFDDHRITVTASSTPLAEAMWATSDPPRSLRLLFFGGAALSDWPPVDLPYRLINAYGPTENSITTSAYELVENRTPPLNRIGGPIAGTDLHILDDQGHQVPVGVTAEIVVSGRNLALGYLNRPELTAEKFTTIELDGESVRAYRTGDLGRWLADGTVEFLGRADRQLEIRGHRIEPGEIEHTLLAFPEVTGAVVRGFPDRTPALVAYVTPAGLAAEDLKARLRERLPAPLVPDVVVTLAEFPLNSSGKVDENALLFPTRTGVHGPGTEPRTDTERRIARHWSELLELDEVGIHENFFDLGGNSLVIARLHSRLISELGREIPIIALFEHPTVASFAASLHSEPGPIRPRRPARSNRRNRAVVQAESN